MKTNKTAAKTALNSVAKVTSKPVRPSASLPATASVKAAAASPAAPKTVIDAKVDVGYGNALYLRGQGPGLTWERGVPLQCVDGKTWRWSQEATAPITFKLLLNDQVWSTGHDLTIAPGQRLEIAPSFS